MSEFKVGEIVIDIKNNEEVEILGIALGKNVPKEYYGAVPNRIYYQLSNDCFATEKYLRKKKPPEELSSWEQVQKTCHWSPNEVEA
ncbi:MAG: hypothetical protein OEX12_05855 [Gammaproteobacteria bacterium]|nr:hypothetical protein [Gammaproteobacteria bacterium]